MPFAVQIRLSLDIDARRGSGSGEISPRQASALSELFGLTSSRRERTSPVSRVKKQISCACAAADVKGTHERILVIGAGATGDDFDASCREPVARSSRRRRGEAAELLLEQLGETNGCVVFEHRTN
ncbi:hypothetical protein NicSoilB8_45280 (plasmid) [Arthrobacter sp. NicSoilB8]|nr:hypothetical protein NicSoilB8_45280 [Arthrobacter sp. NicSoilB8]